VRQNGIRHNPPPCHFGIVDLAVPDNTDIFGNESIRPVRQPIFAETSCKETHLCFPTLTTPDCPIGRARRFTFLSRVSLSTPSRTFPRTFSTTFPREGKVILQFLISGPTREIRFLSTTLQERQTPPICPWEVGPGLHLNRTFQGLRMRE